MKNQRTRLLGGNAIIPDICQSPGNSGLVSVIIPTYNRGYIINKAIDSVLGQTYDAIELIVVDDGSNDETPHVVKEYGSKVRYIYQENSGLAVARNTGLAAANGEFIAFQDSDDIWQPWKLQVQVCLMRHVPKLAIVWTDMTAVTPDGEIVCAKYLRKMYDVYNKVKIDEFLPRIGVINEIWPDCPLELQEVSFRCGDIFSPMFLGNFVHPPTALLRREHLCKTGGLDITFSWTCEDYEFFWRVFKEGLGGLIEAPSILYRVDAEDQLTKPQLLLYIARGNLAALQRISKKDFDIIMIPQHKIRHHMANSFSWAAIEELRCDDGSRRKAVEYFLKSLRNNLFQGRAIFNFLLLFTLPKTLFNRVRSIKRKLFSHRTSKSPAE